MKILCVIDSLCMGGAQRQLVELAIGFSQRGNDVYFLTYRDIPFFKPRLEKAGINITCLTSRNYIQRVILIRRFIRGGDFDAVLSFLQAVSFICEISGLPKKKWKLVVGERSANPRILKSFKSWIYRWFHFLADYIVSNSEANINLVRSINPLLPSSKCLVIYNIIDFDHWSSIIENNEAGDEKIILVVSSRVSPLKNLHGLIQAMTLLNNQDISKIEVHWYGYDSDTIEEDSYQSSIGLLKEVRLENVIKIFPASHDLSNILDESDAVGLFSLVEGLPNSVCEGMASGKAIVCSAISDLPNLLSHQSKLLFDPKDPRSMKDALSYLINIDQFERDRIGQLNRKIAKKEFDKDTIVSKYLDLFNS